MAVELNLLPEKKKIVSPEVEGSIGRLQKFAVTLLFAVVVAAVSVFAYGQALLAQKNDLQTKISNLESVIAGYKEREILLVLLKQKVLGIKTVLASRPDMSAEMVLIKSLLPPGAAIGGLTGDKSGQFTCDLTVDNSATLDTVVRAFTQNIRFKDVVVSNLAGNLKDGYKFSLSLREKEGTWL